MADHARDVNILIWTSHKSVGHETNDRIMVHGDGTRADGRKSMFGGRLNEIMGSRARRSARSKRDLSSNVVDAQAGYVARPATEAPETQVYFTTHRSGAFPVLRLRTVVRGERASRSIVNRTTALWSIWGVASLILAGLGLAPPFVQTHGRGVAVSRGSDGAPKIAKYPPRRTGWTLPLTNG